MWDKGHSDSNATTRVNQNRHSNVTILVETTDMCTYVVLPLCIQMIAYILKKN